MRSLFFPFRKVKPNNGVRYATLSSRFFAMTLDMIFAYFIVIIPLVWVSGLLFPDLPMEVMMAEGQALSAAIESGQVALDQVWEIALQKGMVHKIITDYAMQIFATGVLVIWSWQRWNTTPGLAIIGIEIVDAETGGTPSLKQYIYRFLGLFIAMPPLMLGMLWMVIDRRKQGWQDKIAGTLVLKKKSWLLGAPYPLENAKDEGEGETPSRSLEIKETENSNEHNEQEKSEK